MIGNSTYCLIAFIVGITFAIYISSSFKKRDDAMFMIPRKTKKKTRKKKKR